MPIEMRFDDLDLREEPARGEGDRSPLFGSSNTASETCTATKLCTRTCCTCSPG
ncbi:MAG TPA: hypothetical protein VK669_03260 [Candidatus Limnocylindrales bacterium]|nr:hypothetical protein [Candidatus Limnocylindrales bacterium]